jgi:exonuclease SbcC
LTWFDRIFVKETGLVPIRLSLSGFLSYREPVEIDFTMFDLACISGANGAGKSSLLDAITWVLFGEARRRDDALINAQSKEASVSLVFAYEGITYRVQRSKQREKTAMLEFQVQQSESIWKPLTERTLRDTQAKIEETLRLNYELFVNASFFLQGKADQFTQQKPGDRKRILGSILGLDAWEIYRQRAADRRRTVEEEVDRLDGRLHEIQAELAEEDSRRENLSRLEQELERLSLERAAQETVLENIRRVAAALSARRNLVETLRRQAETTRTNLGQVNLRLANSQQERSKMAVILDRAGEIEAGYARLQTLREELQRWDEVAGRFREQERLREVPRREIEAARSRLEGELDSLQTQEKTILAAEIKIPALQEQLDLVKGEIQSAEERISLRERYRSDLEERRKGHIHAQAENRALKAEMDELSERIRRLKEVNGAVCPFCGQALNPADRKALISSLEARGKEMGDRYRANKIFIQETESVLYEIEQSIASLRSAEADQRAATAKLAGLASQLDNIFQQKQEWLSMGANRLHEIQQALLNESYAPEARQTLFQVDEALKKIGYDAETHDRVRKAEMEARVFDSQVRQLEQARAALAPLERQISELQAQVRLMEVESKRQMDEY